jgi:hypothetical protein
MQSWFVVSLFVRTNFQFSIRSLLLLAVVVALQCGWLAVEMRQAARQKNLVAAIEHSGGSVLYENDLSGTQGWRPNPLGLRKLLGDDFFDNIWDVRIRNDAGLKCIKDFNGFPQLIIGCEQWTPIQPPAPPDNHGDLTDAGMKEIEDLPDIYLIYILDCPALTDRCLESLARLPNLECLRLPLQVRVGCPDWHRCKITREGVKKLQRALPNCVIEYAW